MEELNICTLFILSNQPTTQPAYQPKSEKCAYLWRFSTNLVQVWYGVSKWKDSTYVLACTEMTINNNIRILQVVLVVGLSWASNGINFGLKNLHLAVRALP